jgi:hypothetical protein
MTQESCTSTDIDSVDAEIQALIDGFISAMGVVPDLEDAESVERRETDLRDRVGALSAKVLERDIQAAIDSEEIRKDERELIKGWPKKLKNRGVREVTLQTSWGIAITIRVRYYSGNGKKAKGKGIYPGLRLLGIYDRCTPVTGSEVARTLAALSSMEEARNELQQRGIRLSVNAIRRIGYQWAERVRRRLGHEAVQLADKPGKRRVVVSSDGGRVRIRRNKKGQKTKKGRSRYHTDWKEPKLLIIYTVDEQGRREKQFSPYIDGT